MDVGALQPSGEIGRGSSVLSVFYLFYLFEGRRMIVNVGIIPRRGNEIFSQEKKGKDKKEKEMWNQSTLSNGYANGSTEVVIRPGGRETLSFTFLHNEEPKGFLQLFLSQNEIKWNERNKKVHTRHPLWFVSRLRWPPPPPPSPKTTKGEGGGIRKQKKYTTARRIKCLAGRGAVGLDGPSTWAL